MLSYEFMGLLALWILWINTALIAAAALIDVARLRKPFAGFRPLAPGATGLGFVRGEIEAPASGPFAHLSVNRSARLADGPEPVLHFGAEQPDSVLLGGNVRAGELRIEVEAAPCRVWMSPELTHARLAEFTAAEFEDAKAQAEKRRGFQKTTAIELGGEQTVYLGGRFESGSSGLRLVPHGDQPLLISTIDPLRFIRAQTTKTWAFVISMVLVLGLITWAALSEPRFGPLSKLGGVLGLAYFLLVLPIATWFRERTRAPDLRSYFGRWRGPSSTRAQPVEPRPAL